MYVLHCSVRPRSSALRTTCAYMSMSAFLPPVHEPPYAMFTFVVPLLRRLFSVTPLRGSPGVATIGTIAARSTSNVAMYSAPGSAFTMRARAAPASRPRCFTR